MDRFRVRTGELLGIVVPGLLLLENLALAFTKERCGGVIAGLVTGHDKSLGDQAMFVFILFAASYVAGFALRLITPDIADWGSATIRLLYRRHPTYLSERFPYWRMFRNQYKNGPAYFGGSRTAYWAQLNDDFDALDKINRELPSASEQLPFTPAKGIQRLARWIPEGLVWLTDAAAKVARRLRSKVNKSTPGTDLKPQSNTVRTPQSEADKVAREMFNSYKLLILARSSELADEVFFAEGITRLLCGLVYASFVGLLAYGVSKWWAIGPCEAPTAGHWLFPLVNLVLFLFFLWGVRHVRAREAFVVYHAFGFAIPQSRSGE